MKNLQPEIIDKILFNKVIEEKDFDDLWIIVTKKGIFKASNGRVFYDYYDQAWKSWYNEVRWSVRREYQMFEATKAGFTGSWWTFNGPLSGTSLWNAFKNTMIEDYGFQIIRVKDAKRNVRCESRTEGEC